MAAMAHMFLDQAGYIDVPEEPEAFSPMSKVQVKTRRDGIDEFDFGRGDALPPQQGSRYLTPPEEATYDQAVRTDRPVFRSLARSRDRELLQYLASRHISPGFLHEIDLLLDGHLELAEHCPDFVDAYNRKRPLAAYLFFVKGYTRPARYVNNYLPDDDRGLLAAAGGSDFTTMKHDDELQDFFDGYEYRWDILAKIDEEAQKLCNILMQGGRLSHAQRTLVVLAMFGNVVDAYKYYEYNYQTDWLPHRYLPEHVMLLELPKSQLAGPVPHHINRSGRECGRISSHHLTRARMARAHDAGVDVLDVLRRDLEAECVRSGLKRWAIYEVSAEAQHRIDDERQHPTGQDVVDLVMDLVPQRPHRLRYSRKRKPQARGRRHAGGNLNASKAALESLMKRENALLQALERSRAGGDAGWNFYTEYSTVKDSRIRLERRFVGEMTAYMRASGRWSNNKCRDIMWRHSKGQFNVLSLCR